MLGRYILALSGALTLPFGAACAAALDVAAPAGAQAAQQMAAVAPLQPSADVVATTPERMQQKGPSGLPVPRWVSLKAGRVNVRQGPSSDQAILWTYVREGLPVEVIAEYDTWRRIRDRTGETGWVRQQLVSGRRTVVVMGQDNAPMTAKPGSLDKVVALAAPGLVAELQTCKGQWCEVSARGYDGYISRDRLWGVYLTE